MAGNEFDRAMDKLRDEMAAQHDHPGICALGEHMTALLQLRMEAAGAILAPGKTLMGAYGALEKEAKKRLSKGSRLVVISDEEGFRIAENYFGIDPAMEATRAPAAPPSTPMALDLDALLGL